MTPFPDYIIERLFSLLLQQLYLLPSIKQQILLVVILFFQGEDITIKLAVAEVVEAHQLFVFAV